MKDFCEIKEDDLIETDEYRFIDKGIFKVYKVSADDKRNPYSLLSDLNIDTLYFNLLDCSDDFYSSVTTIDEEDLKLSIKAVYRKDGKDYKCIWERG